MKKIIAAIGCLSMLVQASAQNVGIGTNSPQSKLHVAGNIMADTVKPAAIKLMPNAGTGKVLTSDANGNASWQGARNGTVGFGTWGDCSMNGISEYNPVTDPTGVYYESFGNSVSISGNYAIIGAYADDLNGSATIYQFNGTNWVFMQKLVDATGSPFDAFGHSVFLSGNFAIVGAPTDKIGSNLNQGSVSIFQLTGGTWVFQQKITETGGIANDYFGVSVSLAGTYAVVGIMGSDVTGNFDQGSVNSYLYDGSSWNFIQKISDPAGASGDYFGSSVSISGNYVIAGAPGDDEGAGSQQGSVSIFRFIPGNGWMPMQKITNNGPGANDNFGYSVSISGDWAIVGAYLDNSALGTATLFQTDGSNWALKQQFSNPGGSDDFFGSYVSISGNYAIIGASGDDVNLNGNQGSATIYMRVGVAWQRLQYVTDPQGNESEFLGNAVSIDGTTQRFLLGIPDYAFQAGKVIFGKIN